MYPNRDETSFTTAVFSQKCAGYVPPSNPTEPTNPTPPTGNNGTVGIVDDGGVEGWVIAVGVIGSLIVVGVIVCIIYCIYRKCKEAKEEQEGVDEEAPTNPKDRSGKYHISR